MRESVRQSAAMASLLDASFEIPEVNIWVDPSGRKWQLDFDAPMFVPALRQVLEHYMHMNAWHRARDHTFGESLGVSLDLIPGKARLRQAMRHSNFQEVYFLGAILQGAMDLHSEASLLRAEDGLVTCKWCSQVVLGSPWTHISWGVQPPERPETQAHRGFQQPHS